MFSITIIYIRGRWMIVDFRHITSGIREWCPKRKTHVAYPRRAINSEKYFKNCP